MLTISKLGNCLALLDDGAGGGALGGSSINLPASLGQDATVWTCIIPAIRVSSLCEETAGSATLHGAMLVMWSSALCELAKPLDVLPESLFPKVESWSINSAIALASCTLICETLLLFLFKKTSF